MRVECPGSIIQLYQTLIGAEPPVGHETGRHAVCGGFVEIPVRGRVLRGKTALAERRGCKREGPAIRFRLNLNGNITEH